MVQQKPSLPRMSAACILLRARLRGSVQSKPCYDPTYSNYKSATTAPVVRFPCCSEVCFSRMPDVCKSHHPRRLTRSRLFRILCLIHTIRTMILHWLNMNISYLLRITAYLNDISLAIMVCLAAQCAYIISFIPHRQLYDV